MEKTKRILNGLSKLNFTAEQRRQFYKLLNIESSNNSIDINNVTGAIVEELTDTTKYEILDKAINNVDNYLNNGYIKYNGLLYKIETVGSNTGADSPGKWIRCYSIIHTPSDYADSTKIDFKVTNLTISSNYGISNNTYSLPLIEKNIPKDYYDTDDFSKITEKDNIVFKRYDTNKNIVDYLFVNITYSSYNSDVGYNGTVPKHKLFIADDLCIYNTQLIYSGTGGPHWLLVGHTYTDENTIQLCTYEINTLTGNIIKK